MREPSPLEKFNRVFGDNLVGISVESLFWHRTIVKAGVLLCSISCVVTKSNPATCSDQASLRVAHDAPTDTLPLPPRVSTLVVVKHQMPLGLSLIHI